MTPPAVLTALSSVLLAAASAGAQEPRASARDVVEGTGRVERVDTFSRGLTIKTAERPCARGIRHVRDPRLLDGLQAGDVVEITFTRARAVALRRQP